MVWGTWISQGRRTRIDFVGGPEAGTRRIICVREGQRERIQGEMAGMGKFGGGGQSEHLVQWKCPRSYKGDPTEDSKQLRILSLN